MKKFLPLAAMLLLMAALAFAQVNVTGLSGIVTDQTGASVPGVTVQVVNPATGEQFSVVTSEKGEYAVASMPAATYRVTFTKAGFKTHTAQNVALIVGVPGTLNVKLEVGAAAESVEVTAGADVVQATTADVSSNLTGKQITDLPFATRDAIELTVDLPGTSTPTTPRSSSINGLPKGAINVTIDGMNTQDNMLKSSDGFFSYINPSVDSLEEVTMETSAAGVDSTSQGGAQIKFVTRSGTNAWHGGGFWQGRNTWFNANYFYNNQAGLPRDTIHLNQEGGHIGGPILKNKLFFFGNVELYRYPGTNNYSRNFLNPTAASGIYTYNGNQQVNLLALAQQVNASLPAGSTPYPTTADPTFAKTYAAIQQYAANGQVKNNFASGDYNTLTTSYLPSGTDARDFFTTRLDYLINSKNSLSFVYNYDWYNAIPDLLNGLVPVYPGTGDVLFSSLSTGQGSNRFDGTISLRTTINPRMTNEWRMGLNGGTVDFFVAISPGLFAPWRGYVPSFASAGTSLSGVATPDASIPQRRNAPVKNLGDTVTWVKGSHQVSFGGNWDQINVYQQIEGSSLFPTLSLGIASNDPVNTGATSMFTAANFPGASNAQLGYAAGLYADVVGRVSGITQTLALSEQTHQYAVTAPIDRDQLREYGFFVQDQWHALPSLTVNVGLRMEKQTSFENLDNLYTEVPYQGLWGTSGVGNLFAPGANSGVIPTYNQITGSPYNPPLVWAPSIGLAWQTPAMEGFLGALFGHHAGATVLRGGYSISTVREGMQSYVSLFGANQGLSIDDSVNPGAYPQYFGSPGSVEFSQATLPTRPVNTSPSYPLPATAGSSMYGVDPNLKMGYVQSWNFSLQREIDRNTVVDFRFVGNHGTDLWRVMNLNEVNIFGSSPTGSFLSQFLAAQNNLAIERGGNINNPSTPATAGNYNNWGNLGLPGQVAVPMLSTAVGTSNDATTAGYLQYGQAGSFANSIADNPSRMAFLTNAGYPSNLLVVNPTIGGTGSRLASSNVLTNNGASYFDAFQVEVRRRLAGGLLFNGNYQFAKSLADGATASSTDSASASTLRNMALDRMPSGFDIRHDIKLNWLYELPFGPGRAFASGGPKIVKKLLEGWELSGVVRIQSGTPLNFSSLDTMNQNGSGIVLHNITIGQLQSMVGNYKTNYPGSAGSLVFYLPPPASTPSGTYDSTYFKTLNSTNNTNLLTNTMAAFGDAGMTPYQVDPNAPYISPAGPGQMGWNGYLYLPWQHHFDLSLQKNTRLGEHAQLEFAVHALDVLNITNFLPGNSTTSSTFGTTTTAYRDISGSVDPGSRIIEWILRVNF